MKIFKSYLCMSLIAIFLVQLLFVIKQCGTLSPILKRIEPKKLVFYSTATIAKPIIPTTQHQ